MTLDHSSSGAPGLQNRTALSPYLTVIFSSVRSYHRTDQNLLERELVARWTAYPIIPRMGSIIYGHLNDSLLLDKSLIASQFQSVSDIELHSALKQYRDFCIAHFDELLEEVSPEAGNLRLWSVLHEPSAQNEDARRTHRELARLAKERTAHTNRIGSLLVLHNLRPHIIGGRDWAHWWGNHREEVPPVLRAEIEHECARLALVKLQIKELEAARQQEISEGKQPLVAQLIKLRAIGSKGAWILVKELFGWRHFANRRELAGCLGLAPTPYASGDSQIEQGISKAGNKRARALLVELSWGWLRLQPASALSQWFSRRFAGVASACAE